MSNLRVDTISTLAQWRIENYGPYTQSLPFKLGIWSWQLTLKNSGLTWCILLNMPQPLAQPPPLASCVLRVTDSASLPYATDCKKLLPTNPVMSWLIEYNVRGRLIIEVEFFDLTLYPNNGGNPTSMWSCDGMMHTIPSLCLSRMLDESIHADVTINLADGTLRAHKAVLCACSPVLQAMFHHNLKEKETSVINIEDISLELCSILLSYLYGTIKQEDFWKHRMSLVETANKYDIPYLKDACERSLLEDINSANVLDRVEKAWFYNLDKLKQGCLRYLFQFRKFFAVREEMNKLFKKQADPEILFEIFQETLAALARP